MRLIEHGNTHKEDELELEEFKCDQCGCKFEADKTEYYQHESSYSYPLQSSNLSSITYCYPGFINYICSCPECHKIIVKQKSNTYKSYWSTLNSSVSDAILSSQNANLNTTYADSITKSEQDSEKE